MTVRGIERLADVTRGLADLSPEVGADLHDQPLLHPTIDDGLHNRRLAVGDAQVHKILFGELHGKGLQIAEVALSPTYLLRVVVQGVDLVAIDLQLVVQATLSEPYGETDGLLRLLTAFKQIAGRWHPGPV